MAGKKHHELRAENLRCRYQAEGDSLTLWFYRRVSGDHLKRLHDLSVHLAECIGKRKNKIGIQAIKLSIIGAQMTLDAILRFLLPRWGAIELMDYIVKVMNDEARELRKSN